LTDITKHEGARGTKVFSAPITTHQAKFILLAASRRMQLIVGLPDVVLYRRSYAYTDSGRTCFAGSLQSLAGTTKSLTKWKAKNEDRLSDRALADIASCMKILRDLLMCAVQDEG